jgi:catechol 2,3-dioxygenase-like lactoylglutathione lyase family enzyme
MPVRDAAAAVDYYRDRLGFEVHHHDGGFAVVGRDEVALTLWQASDEDWRASFDPARPVCSGAESFIAGTASSRVETQGVDELFAELRDRDVLHPVSKAVTATEWGTREFSALDLDGNLISFFERVDA